MYLQLLTYFKLFLWSYDLFYYKWIKERKQKTGAIRKEKTLFHRQKFLRKKKRCTISTRIFLQNNSYHYTTVAPLSIGLWFQKLFYLLVTTTIACCRTKITSRILLTRKLTQVLSIPYWKKGTKMSFFLEAPSTVAPHRPFSYYFVIM